MVENKSGEAGRFANVVEVGAKEITSFCRHVSLYKPLIFFS